MKKTLIYLLLIFLFSPFLKAEIVKDVVISGNERISDETIKIYGEIEINKDYKDRDLDNILKNLYETDFFEDIKVSLNGNKLSISLKEYPVINQLIIVGEKSNRFKDQIKKIIQLKEKRSFIKSYLAKDIETIKSLYSALGYNFSKVETKVKKIDDKNFDLLIEVERGDQTKYPQ